MDNNQERPKLGEFRILRREGALSRLVVVNTLQNPYLPKSNIMLVTNEVEYGTDDDILIDPEDSGLAYPVLIETGIVAPVWNRHLDEPLGRLAAKHFGILDPINPDFSSIDDLHRGLQYSGPSDTRIAWRTREMIDLQPLHALGEGIED